MSNKDKEPLGYVVCKTCLTPKAIYQGSGQRKNYVYGRCECGPDNRTGKQVQALMKACRPLEEVQAEIERLTNPVEVVEKPQPEPKPSEPDSQPDESTDSESKAISTTTCVGVGAALGLLIGGAVKAIKAVA